MGKGKILITGGTGYIGSHTAVELLEDGYEVIILDNLSNSTEDVIDRLEKITGIRPVFEKADICDVRALESFFNTYQGITGIIHFAALKSVNESVSDPMTYYRNNVGGLINIIDQAQKQNIRNFIFSSSCTVYGQPKILPVTEETPLMPTSPYGNSKKMGESILQDIASESLNIIALRYFNPVGAHPSALIGELPNGIPNNLMPFITQTAAGIRSELLVYGNDYNTPDGTAIRDYIHVVDLAKAHVKALERLVSQSSQSSLEVFNIGAGNGYSVLEIIQSFEKTTGQKLNWQFAPRRAGDIEKIWADVSISNEKLNWRVEMDLDKMTKTAWDWQQNLI